MVRKPVTLATPAPVASVVATPAPAPVATLAALVANNAPANPAPLASMAATMAKLASLGHAPAPVVTPAPQAPVATVQAPAGTHIANSGHVVVHVVANPKKGASRARFAAYAIGQTVQQAIAAGVTRADIRWDMPRNLVVVAPATCPSAQAAVAIANGATGAALATAQATIAAYMPSLLAAQAAACAGNPCTYAPAQVAPVAQVAPDPVA